MIDLDPQAHLTASFGFNPDELNERGSCEILKNEFDVAGIAIDPPYPSLALIPSNLSLADVEFAIVSVPGRDTILKSYINRVIRADYVLIDCPPSLGVLTLNALTASDKVYIPMQAEYLPLRGVRGLIDTIELVRERLNPALEIAGVISTRVDTRKILTRDVLTNINAHFGERALNAHIRENISIAEAPAHGKSIFDYAPDSNGARDFEGLVSEIISIEERTS